MAASSTKPTVAYIVSNELVKYSSLLPSNKNRSLLVHSLVKSYGLLSPGASSEANIRLMPPVPADRDALAMYHSNGYLDFILDPQNSSGDASASAGDDGRHAEFGVEE